jgi:hypothetical protein
VTARPITTGKWVLSIAGLIVLAFVIIALTLPRSTTLGADVTLLDRASMLGLGLFLAALVAAPARPRVQADARGVRTRGFVGGYREVPWLLVQAVEFPPRARWAQLVLDQDETIQLYAIQRSDGLVSIETMDRLRELHRRSQG